MNTEVKEKAQIQIRDLGLIEYAEAYAIQQKCVQDVLGGAPQTLLLCEHPAVLTLGRLADESHILYPKEELEKKGIQIRPIDRGGEVTLHSPGQLVIYPILNLAFYGKDLKAYLFELEQVSIDFLREFDILAERFSGRTGAWVGPKKIASIGVGVKKWISFHGLAINVNTDLNLFSLIRPCGLDVQMSSIQQIQGKPIDMALAKTKLIEVFQKNFHLTDQ